MRTTVNLDGTVLKRLKRRARLEGKTLGELMSELLSIALEPHEREGERRRLAWSTKAMGAKVDLEDRDALFAALEER